MASRCIGKKEIRNQYVNNVINIALDTLRSNKQLIVFCGTKRGAEKSAEDIASKIKNVFLNDLEKKTLSVLSRPTKQCEKLAKCINRGVAFHHSGLHSKQRELIEDNFRSEKIKVICCTPTLAAGVDLPAFRVVIRDVTRFGGATWGHNYIPVLEYLQMAGRAGRPRFDKVIETGEAIILAKDENTATLLKEKYVDGVPEEIFSKLAVEPVLRTYLLSLISIDFADTKEKLMEFFSRTFWAHQYEDIQELEKIISRMLNLLKDWKFIEFENNDSTSETSDFISAENYKSSKITSQKIHATSLGKRVAQLYLDPLTANNLVQGLNKATKETSIFAFLQLVCSTLELRPLLRVKTRESETIYSEYLSLEQDLLVEEPPVFEYDYEDFLSSLKTSLFMNDWISEHDEVFLLEKYDVRPGEIHAKLDRANWILFALEELATLLKKHDLRSKISKIKYRLKNGVSEELIPLLQLKNIGRVRARKLFNQGLKTIGDVKSVDIGSLVQLIGKARAIDIKQQVGASIPSVVPERKRKGQISLNDF